MSTPPQDLSNEDLSNDDDIVAVFNNPVFIRKFVQHSGFSVKELFDSELQIRVHTRIANEKDKIAKRIIQNNYAIQERKNEQDLFAKILSYIWLSYLGIVLGILTVYFVGDYIIHYLGDYISLTTKENILRITTMTLSSLYGIFVVLAIGVLVLSCFVGIFFTDF